MNTERTDKTSLAAPWNARSLLIVGLGSGISAGLVEGVGLLFFQRINWARWGPMIHVSGEITWISPVIDTIIFLLLALLCVIVGRLAPRLPTVRVLVFLLTFLSVYDWLTLTGRLYHRACLVLALGVAVAFVRWCGRREGAFLQFWRRATPWIVAAWLLTFAGIQGGKWLGERIAVAQLPAAAPEAPNVLVIVVDTLRADHLSAYGYARPVSPNFDRLAAQGVLFENAISTTSWSLPSHVSLLTGRYQFEHGVGNVQPEPWTGWGRKGLGGSPTLGEALQQKGYRTGAFSANRTYFTTSLGFGRGFQHFEDYFHSPADMFVRTLYGREFARLYLNRSDKSKVKRALRFLGMNSMLDKDSEGSGNYGGAQGVRKRADVVNREVLRWIDRGSTGGAETHPWFAFLNYFDVHYPYGGPPTYPKPGWDQGSRIDEYDAGIKYADDALGRLVQALEQRGLANHTLLIVTSDHGEALGQHHLTYHGQALYRELIHVPLVMWYPGHVPAGITVPGPVTNAAIPATIMDLLGAGAQQRNFPSASLSALWQSGGVRGWPDVLSELAQNDIADKEDKAAAKVEPTASTGSMESLVMPQWQLITHEAMGDQLYDWVLDPAESNNQALAPEGQARAAGLKSSMENILRPEK
ncbi:MAG: sulfatase-like hydrolase/transferase [Terriglobales bacterium]